MVGLAAIPKPLCQPLALMVRIGTVLLLAALPTGRVAAADGPTGEQIFQKQCASCHGAAGEGTKVDYPKALTGDKSVPQLAKVIAKTMPKDDPGACTGANADKVAAYIYDAFYSKAAQERNHPPRIELSRLTVRQYQNAVADLLAGFRTLGRWDDKRGLRGEYFDARNFQNNKRLIDRLDPEVQFDFKTDGPTDKFNASQFSIRWEGSVLAPETGMYEFVVRTEHATRLWINDTRKAAIDAWVKSGSDTEYRASVFLAAGRAYPLRLEFSKAKQGVDDSKKNPKPPPPVKASVALLWKPPQQSVEVIPARYLTPNRFPETCVIETPFPPDDRSLGWERATTISKAWDQATTDAAIETAGYVAAHLGDLAGVRDDAKDRDAQAREFCRKFAERAFRRPLTDEQKRLFIDRQFDAAGNTETAVKRVVLLVLSSPRFLYREIGGPDQYDVASRLSFALWDSVPDDELLSAAAAGKLATRDQVAKQAERMLADNRARAKVRQFFLQWLKIEQPPEIAKDPARFPGFDAAIVADLRTSLDLFLEDVIWSDDSDFRRLLLADDLYLNGRLAKFYSADLADDAPFQKVKLNPEQRAGVLTHPYLMAAFSYTGSTSPIHRGVFLTRGVLGVTLRPPPEAFTPLAENVHPNLTTRERVLLQTKPNACQSCHGVINPLGFTLENFDAVGRYREKDNGHPIDASGTYLTRKGNMVKFTGARELAKFLAGSDEVQTAFTEHLFQHLAKQPVRAYGPRQLDELRESFVHNGCSIRKLIVDIAATSALIGRDAKPSPKPSG